MRQTADRLGEALVGGDPPPGSPLVEAALCTRLGVSRTTVREALRLLAAEGLVTYAPHRGCRVARLSEADAVDIYRVRLLLETEGVRRPGNVPTRVLDELAAAADDLDAAAGRDWLGFVAADLRFHGLLVGLLGSRRLDATYAGMARELRLALSILDRAAPDLAATATEQRRIMTLLAAGRRDECVALLRRHLEAAAALLAGSLREQQTAVGGRRAGDGHPPSARGAASQTITPAAAAPPRHAVPPSSVGVPSPRDATTRTPEGDRR